MNFKDFKSRIFVITVLSFYFNFELHVLVFDDMLKAYFSLGDSVHATRKQKSGNVIG